MGAFVEQVTVFNPKMAVKSHCAYVRILILISYSQSSITFNLQLLNTQTVTAVSYALKLHLFLSKCGAVIGGNERFDSGGDKKTVGVLFSSKGYTK